MYIYNALFSLLGTGQAQQQANGRGGKLPPGRCQHVSVLRLPEEQAVEGREEEEEDEGEGEGKGGGEREGERDGRSTKAMREFVRRLSFRSLPMMKIAHQIDVSWQINQL